MIGQNASADAGGITFGCSGTGISYFADCDIAYALFYDVAHSDETAGEIMDGLNTLFNTYITEWTPPTTDLWDYWVAERGVHKDASEYVSNWHGQYASNNLSQSTAANQPLWSNAPTGFNNRNAILFDGTNDYLKTGIDVSLQRPTTFYGVLTHDGHFATDRFFDGWSNNGFSMQQYGSSPDISLTAGGGVVTNGDFPVDLSSPHIISGRSNGTDSYLRVDKLTKTTPSGSIGGNHAQGLTLCSRADGAAQWGQMRYAYFIVYGVKHDSTTEDAIIDALNGLFAVY
jgi:hypothetical protein